MILFFLTFTVVYSTINYYIFRRGAQALSLKTKKSKRRFFLLLLVPVLSYVAAKGLLVKSDSIFYDIFLWVGSFWFAYLVYFLVSLLIIDLTRVILNFSGLLRSFSQKGYEKLKSGLFYAVLLITTVLVFLGHSNANNIVVKKYNIDIPKKNGEIDTLNVLFFSDSHFTPINNGRIMHKIIEIADSIKPDLILMSGDIVDDKSNNLKRYNIDKELRNLNAKFGVFTCNGNHEHIVDAEDAVNFLQSNGVSVIIDTFITINNSIQIIGREDRSVTRFRDTPRKSLTDIMNGIDRNLPIILLDHQPFELEEAANHGIDLQLSGHTHHGQMFPGNLITSIVYELSYGFLKKGKTQFYVTSGVGTWGPPVRIGSESEVVHFVITFTE